MRVYTVPHFIVILCAVALVMLVVFDAEGRGRGGRGGGFSRGGPAAGGSFGHQRSPGIGSRNRSNNRSDRSQNRSDNRSDRAENRSDNRNDRSQDRREYADDRHDDRREFVEDRHRLRVGAYLTASAFGAMSCRPTVVVVGAMSYSQCGGGWYQRAYRGGSVTYIVVNAPSGY